MLWGESEGNLRVMTGCKRRDLKLDDWVGRGGEEGSLYEVNINRRQLRQP